ncbi:MoxR-like ATPase [Opitutaceae bacterium TAV1]|nr:MoxR-like ATPase [Opitutaceae bacterium TAV1]
MSRSKPTATRTPVPSFHPLAARSPTPPWRRFRHADHNDRGAGYVPTPTEIDSVNAALQLRRPLLVTGKPGTGKSTLAHAVASQLDLGSVLVWPITSRSTLHEGLYSYDAVGRLHAASLAASTRKTKPDAEPDIGGYLRLGALGTALALATEDRPTVLLIDEIDKSDIDLPNDLLHLFEEGYFVIPELARLGENVAVQVGLHDRPDTTPIKGGRVSCSGFPFVVLTSNGERDFPPAFLRRCLRLDLPPPNKEQLASIVANRLEVAPSKRAEIDDLLNVFLELRDTNQREISTDQLLNAAHLVLHDLARADSPQLKDDILRSLSS